MLLNQVADKTMVTAVQEKMRITIIIILSSRLIVIRGK
jgi:hypothetical protein